MALIAAVRAGQLDEVKRVVEAKANVNETDEQSQSALLVAAQLPDDGSIFRFLLHKCRKLDVNLPDAQGWTPLLATCVDRHYDRCIDLLSNKATKPALSNSEFNTPLMYLCRRPPAPEAKDAFVAVLTELVLKNVDLNQRNCFGETAAHFAAGSHNLPALAFLSENRANMNAINNRGETPLCYALKASLKTDTVAALLRFGADPDITAHDGKPLSELAKSDEIRDILANNRSFDMMVKRSLGSFREVEKELIETTMALNSVQHRLSEQKRLTRKSLNATRRTTAQQFGTLGRSGRKAHKQVASSLEIGNRHNEQLRYAHSGPWMCCVYQNVWRDESTAEAVYSSMQFIDEIFHKNILPIIQLRKAPCELQMFVSFPSATLAEFITQSRYSCESGYLEAKTIFQLALEIAQGLEYLHKSGVVHRTLNCSHIYVMNEEKGKPIRLALAPFFLCKREAPWVVDSGNFDFYNSARYWAPEVRAADECKSHTLASDIWAFGIVLFSLLTLQEPYAGTAQLSDLENNERPELPSSFRQDQLPAATWNDPLSPGRRAAGLDMANYQPLIDMFQVCTNPDPTQRPTIADVIKALRSGISIKEICGLSLRKGPGSLRDWPESRRTFVRLPTMNDSSLIEPTPGFVIENPVPPPDSQTTVESNPVYIQYVDRSVAHYADNLALSPHDHFAGQSEQGYVVLVSIETEGQFVNEQYHYKMLLRTKDEDYRIIIPADQPKDRNRQLKQHPMLIDYTLMPLKEPNIKEALIDFEKKHLETKNYKFGIIYRRSGQVTDDEMLSNEDGSPEFEQFLDFLGDRITLKGWTGFRGGLDTNSDTTGTHALHTFFRDFEIMFHTSTLLPHDKGNPQQLHRKRHIGNDVVVIIFQEEGADRFTPKDFASHFNHVFVVVEPYTKPEPLQVTTKKSKLRKKLTSMDNPAARASQPFLNNTSSKEALSLSQGSVPLGGTLDETPGRLYYKVSIAYKESIREGSRPFLQEPCIYPANEHFKELFFTKLINIERVAMRSEQFEKRLQNVRSQLLTHLYTELTSREDKKKGLLW